MSAPILRLSTSQRLVFLVNSRLGLFTAAPLRGLPFSRSYGVILPSSLTKVFPLVLGFSPHLPVSVYGTGDNTRIVAFLGSMESAPSLLVFDTHHTSDLREADLPTSHPLCLHASPTGRYAYPPASPHLRCGCRYRNFHLLSIDYAFRPRLRSRLTLSGRAFLRKPWVFDG